MTNKEFYVFIIRYLNGSLAKEERAILVKMLQDEKRLEGFKKYLSVNYLLTNEFSSFDYQNPLKKALAKIESERKENVKVIKLNTFLKYTAVVSIALLVSVLYIFNSKEVSLFSQPTIETGTDKAILTLENGSAIALERGKKYKSKNVSSNGETIVYKGTNEKDNVEIAYNYLEVPRGGQFYIELSDNTKIWLNSESKIKYPKTFIANQDRVVELLYGEAYFDVSSSTNHNGAIFKVLQNQQEVEVLGTEFNIKAYQDEAKVFTTLVEGNIKISDGNQQVVLVSGEQSIISANNNQITVAEVEVKSAVDWIRGIFNFRKKPLAEICKSLDRWYDIEIIPENENFYNITFTGVIKKSNDIELILETIINSSDVNDYEINGKKIYLK